MNRFCGSDGCKITVTLVGKDIFVGPSLLIPVATAGALSVCCLCHVDIHEFISKD